jgi:DNA-binding MarR family transcriptional regulator
MFRSQSAEPELESALAIAGFLQLTKCTLVVKQRVALEAMRQFKLTTREIWILMAARSAKPVTQKQIARHLVLNENVLVQLLDRLGKSGHARRIRNPENRRQQFVRLTPKGERVVRRTLAEKAKFYRTVFAPLDDASIRAVFEAATTILNFAEAAAKPRRPR